MTPPCTASSAALPSTPPAKPPTTAPAAPPAILAHAFESPPEHAVTCWSIDLSSGWLDSDTPATAAAPHTSSPPNAQKAAIGAATRKLFRPAIYSCTPCACSFGVQLGHGPVSGKAASIACMPLGSTNRIGLFCAYEYGFKSCGFNKRSARRRLGSLDVNLPK